MKRICCIVLLGLMAGFAAADDLTPPPWRGDSGTTLTQWEFFTDEINPIPDVEINPYGEAFLTIYPTHPWQPTWGGREGAWALSGLIKLKIDNNPAVNPFKLIQIQLTWAGQYDSAAAVPTIDVDAAMVTGAPVQLIELVDSVTIDLEPTLVPDADPFWHHTTYLYQIYPNPAIEFIDIGGSVWVDELVIDTICVPEPLTIALLGIGGLLLRKRR